VSCEQEAGVPPGWDADRLLARRPIYVVDAATGSTRKIADGGNPEWFDDHTLILGPSG